MPALPTLCDGDCYPASLPLMPTSTGNGAKSENPPEGKKLLLRRDLENNFAKKWWKAATE